MDLTDQNKKAMQLYYEQIAGGVINDIYESLVVDKSNRPTILERNFVGIYLPMFSGQVPQGDANPYKVSLSTWISDVARSVFTPVDVIDETGEVLYTVPPVCDSKTVKLATDHHNNLRNMVIRSKYLERSSVRGTSSNYELDFMEHNLDNYSDNTYTRAYTEQWERIFKHYGINVNIGQTSKQEETVKEDDTNKDIVFDDFD